METGKKLIGIIGATASGKSDLAMELAKKIDGEIVSADSVQIYKGLNIGSNKPSPADRTSVKHHMIDIVPPDAHFSSNDYADRAKVEIADILSRNKIPLITGGTGFYFYNLFFTSDFDMSYNSETREWLKQIFAEKGSEGLHQLLEDVDPASAADIHPNNVKRVMRALEIYYNTGVKRSEGTGIKTGKDFRQKMPYLFQIDFDRTLLYKRIDARVDEMIKAGLVDEVRDLLKYVDISAQSMQSIGYKELIPYIKGTSCKEDAINAIKQNTRNYAKRQLTYFKRLSPTLLDGTRPLSLLSDDVIIAINNSSSN